jgi:hypothetical protein
MTRPLLTALLLAGAICASPVHAETQYWRVTVDHMTVISDGSAKRCTRLGAQFLAFERLLRELANLDDDFNFRPLTVYGLSDTDARRVMLSDADRQLERSHNARLSSKYLPGRESNFAIMIDDGGDEPLQAVLLLYAQDILLHGPARTFPAWYQVGVANITNGVMVREDGSMLLNRDGPFEPQVDKTVRTKYDLTTLLATKGNELASGGDWKTFARRAREWAQFGLLTTPEHRSQYRELASLMRQGTPAEEAVSQAFGVSLGDLSKQFDEGAWRRQASFRIPASAASPTLPTPERLDTARVNQLLQLIADRVSQPAS